MKIAVLVVVLAAFVGPITFAPYPPPLEFPYVSPMAADHQPGCWYWTDGRCICGNGAYSPRDTVSAPGSGKRLLPYSGSTSGWGWRGFGEW